MRHQRQRRRHRQQHQREHRLDESVDDDRHRHDRPVDDDPGTDSTTVGTGDTTGDDPTGGTTDDPTGDTTAGTTGGVDLGNCCMPDLATAGCEVPEVQDCVCEADPYCCDELWDDNCAAEVNSLGCGECEFPPQAFDCYCLAACDDVPVDTPFQVCGTDFDSASAAARRPAKRSSA